jgi:hypothetical protein
MSVIGLILERLGIQTQASAYNAGYRDMMAYVRGAQAAAGVIGFEPVDVPAEMLTIPAPGATGGNGDGDPIGGIAGLGREELTRGRGDAGTRRGTRAARGQAVSP